MFLVDSCAICSLLLLLLIHYIVGWSVTFGAKMTFKIVVGHLIGAACKHLYTK
jgi:hypothetical protein